MIKKLIASILCVGLLVSLSGCSIRFGVRENNRAVYKDKVTIDESIEYNNESKLSIDMKYGEINVVGYEGNSIVVTGSTNRGENTIDVSKSGDTIKVKDVSSNNINIGIFSSGEGDSTDIEIKVPNGFSGDIDFSYGAGDASIENLVCNKISVDGGAGRLTIDDIVFEKLDFSAGVGQTNINLSEKCGEIDIDGGVGEVNIKLAEVGGDLTFEGGVGSAKIQIPENSPVYFDTSSGIGSSNINAKTSGENTYKFNLEVGIGEIKVYN